MREWTTSGEDLLILWTLHLQIMAQCHKKAACICGVLHQCLWISASIIGTLASAALWAQVGIPEILPLGVSCALLQSIAVALFTLAGALGLAQAEHAHVTTTQQLETIIRAITVCLMVDRTERDDMEVFIRGISAEFRLINATKPTEFLRTSKIDSLPNLPLMRLLSRSSPKRSTEDPRGSPGTCSIEIESPDRNEKYADLLGKSCEDVFRGMSESCDQLLRASKHSTN